MGTPAAGTNARFYYRISEDKTGERLGVERQQPECLELADRLGFGRGEAYTDNDLSATTGVQRPAFEALLRDLKADPSPLIVWHTDRLIRLNRDLERVIDTGVNVYAVHAGHFDLSTPAGRAVARTVTAWAQYEGEQKALRQRTSNRQRAEKGQKWWSSRPFGIKFDGSGLIEDEAQALRDLYSMILAGGSVAACARELNARGFVTTRGKPWTPNSLRPVLLHPRNAGIRRYDGEDLGDATWGKIVDEDTYRHAVRLLTDPSRRSTDQSPGPKARFLLSGILQCGSCGAVMNVANRGKVGSVGHYRVYICRRNHCVSSRLAWMDEVVTELVVKALSTPDSADLWASDDEGDAEDARAEVVKLRERLTAFADDYADGLISREQMVRGTARIREALEAAERRLDASSGSSPLGALLGAQDVREAFLGLPLERQRVVIRWLFSSLRAMPRRKGQAEHVANDLQVVWRNQRAKLEAV